MRGKRRETGRQVKQFGLLPGVKKVVLRAQGPAGRGARQAVGFASNGDGEREVDVKAEDGVN